MSPASDPSIPQSAALFNVELDGERVEPTAAQGLPWGGLAEHPHGALRNRGGVQPTAETRPGGHVADEIVVDGPVHVLRRAAVPASSPEHSDCGLP